MMQVDWAGTSLKLEGTASASPVVPHVFWSHFCGPNPGDHFHGVGFIPIPLVVLKQKTELMYFNPLASTTRTSATVYPETQVFVPDS